MNSPSLPPIDWNPMKWNQRYDQRRIINGECDVLLEGDLVKKTVPTTPLDMAGWGFRSLRQGADALMRRALAAGLSVRIVTVNPGTIFPDQRDAAEGIAKGTTAVSILELIAWADELNDNTGPGSITVRVISRPMPFFYWRYGWILFAGPYEGNFSQETVTFRAERGSDTFEIMTGQFEALWNEAR
ncbi:MAG: hypothetical protein J6S75_01330 [Thermoguttaceae bacterium]|nr:hypothetical protein [Thermoguttaceae bacterium]